MTDHSDYDRLLERGRELYRIIRSEFQLAPLTPRAEQSHYPRIHYPYIDPYVLLALLERHLAQQVREELSGPELAENTSDNSEKCQRCHSSYPYVWHAPDDLWKSLTGITDGSGLFCITCFDAMADNKKILLYWSCARDAFPGIPYSGGKVADG